MKIIDRKKADFTTSSIGLVSYLLWNGIFPDDITFAPYRACVYRRKDIDWAELIDNYWSGDKIPVCELSECIVVSKRILDNGVIDDQWYKEMEDAIKDIQDDYIFPL